MPGLPLLLKDVMSPWKRMKSTLALARTFPPSETEHPFTALSVTCEVHANHNEAQSSALRRRCSAYRRLQNLYAKCRDGLQRLIYN